MHLRLRLYVLWQSLISIADRDGSYFSRDADGEFCGHSDEMRVLVREPDYVDTPRLLPVPLREIEECINSRRKEKKIEETQARELDELITLVRSIQDRIC